MGRPPGVDDTSGNFQESNFGRGGKEVDAVQANGQDGAGTNNGTLCDPVDERVCRPAQV